MSKGPCFGCNKRQMRCHSTCEDYIAYKDRLAQIKAEMIKKSDADQAVRDVLYHDLPNKAKTIIRLRTTGKKRRR